MDQFRAAVEVFVENRRRMVVALVADKVPEYATEDVVSEVMVSAFGSLSTISGVATGQFVNWLKRIVVFKVADFHRSGEGKPRTDSIHNSDDDEEGPFIQIIDHGADRAGEIEVEMVFVEVLGSRSPLHQRAIELRIDDHPSIETAEILGEELESGEIESDGRTTMTPANVDQIYSRFKKDMKKALGLESRN
ncbi:MAG: sigma-70 family RNA polymerase sigma factor [Solirubrobacterales bacterium]|nr:sigma-70 family RNA polymerase sigma factor [Solirubrobacterales bacterium]